MMLSTAHLPRSDKPLASGLGQQALSFALYVGAIPMAWVSPYISLGMICLVAVFWAPSAAQDRGNHARPEARHKPQRLALN